MFFNWSACKSELPSKDNKGFCMQTLILSCIFVSSDSQGVFMLMKLLHMFSCNLSVSLRWLLRSETL